MENTVNLEHDVFNLKHIIRFGGRRVQKFMNENGIKLIIRSHEPVRDGFEKMNNNVVTVFSATDYCGMN